MDDEVLKATKEYRDLIAKSRLWDIQGEIQELQKEAQKLMQELQDDVAK